MGTNSVQALGAMGRDDIFYFEPEQLYIETRPGFPGYDRRHDKPLTEEFLASIRKLGIHTPIIFQRLDGPEGTKLLTRNGRQRIRGALVINARIKAEKSKEPLIRVPARRMRMDEVRAIQVQISANEAVNPTSPLEKAEAAAQLIQQYGLSHEEAAVTMCCNVSTIQNYLLLLDAAPSVQAAVASKALPVKSAVAIARLPEAKQTAAVEQVTKDGPVAGRKARERTAAVTGKDARTVRPKGQIVKLLAELDGHGWRDAAQAVRWILGEDVPQIAELLDDEPKKGKRA
jgi:ParB-like chromosome segregation protein Spo0J